MTKKALPPSHFLNRELGLLEFNRRVLAQAADAAVPLLERLRFLTIVSSNLDEFFEIRVAGLKEQIKHGIKESGPDGHSPAEVFALVAAQARLLVAEQYRLLNEVLLPALAREGIVFRKRETWSDAQRAWVKDHFFRELLPVLTPIGLDPAHPFPRVLNKSLNFAIELEGRDAFGRKSRAAIVQAPRALPRVIRMPAEVAGAPHGFVFLSSIMHAHVDELFSGMEVKGCHQFRVTRNSDLFVDEEEIKNLRIAVQGELLHRHFGDAVRLELADNCSPASCEFLLQQFGLSETDLYRVAGPVNLYRLREVPDQVERADLKYAPFQPGLPDALARNRDIYAVLKASDVLLHHPYQSFDPVIEFIRTAVADARVIAIKQTVYRTGTDSELMEILIDAARLGKEVTVVVELMARFDEEVNINWAARLEEVGAHVIYGVVGHKTHAKMALVVRREDTPQGPALKRYAHLATGNYHPRTARLYTDFGLLTANEDTCADVNEVFKQLTGLGRASRLKHLWLSPFTLHRRVVSAVHNEVQLAREGKPARIIAKMNALLEPELIEELYAASQAGVQIDLIVRGVCALRPGIEGLSDNIRVRSIIGRFLEHTRVFYFRNDGADDVYLASADWMGRNFFRRIELAFPVLDAALKARIVREGLQAYLDDTAQTWIMNADGGYERTAARRGKRPVQEDLLHQLATASWTRAAKLAVELLPNAA
ncbi:MAG: RNA degradosome polyphosphate kinase [Betaproteobacteria bacterium RIFCSPLOWO2_12_FULL_67_28]|nr:MAG: RNA degradosome polyphosphate kinase [Betaproteobacteria bacterium RIFCSPLOWO2_02_FULL_68_150]OGA71506.1 MAG: RNA degradosome polyphosphate kinase [Betaproteobacteria bacterium RIFCSPLOWO2_12_FULL_67_28]